MKKKSLFSVEAEQKKKLKKGEFLSKMEEIVPWSRLLDELKPFYERKSKFGSKSCPLLVMLDTEDPFFAKMVYFE